MGTIVQAGHVVGNVESAPRRLGSKPVRWVNPVSGIVTAGPNSNAGSLAPALVPAGRVSIAEFVTHELHWLEAFEQALDVTIDKQRHGAFGPARVWV